MKQLMILGILVLIFIGFTLTAFISPKYGEVENKPTQTRDTIPYIAGTYNSSVRAKILNLSGKYAVLGGSLEILRLERMIGGEIVVLGEGAIVLNTAAALSEINKDRDENTILYAIALCNSSQYRFDCLIAPDHNMSDMLYFDLYDLNKQSRYFKSARIGIPGQQIVIPTGVLDTMASGG